MRVKTYFMRFISLGTACAIGLGLATFTATASTIGLVSHRAIYDLKLVRTRGQKALESVRGRILYDFSGNPCEGYTLQFRQVSELNSGEGKVTLSDLRANTWEDANAKALQFNTQNFINDRLTGVVEGRAERKKNSIKVTLKKPKNKSFDLEGGIVFPTEHMRRIIEAAQAGKTLLELPVYDGSETGEKTFSTLAVLGHEIPISERNPAAMTGQAALAGLKRWPVTISYFDRAKRDGEQVPVYAISFEIYENGISRALSLDYGDFVIAGEMSRLEIKEMKPCK